MCAQWLDPQYGARAVIKLNHLGEREQSKRAGKLFLLAKDITLLQHINNIYIVKTVVLSFCFSDLREGKIEPVLQLYSFSKAYFHVLVKNLDFFLEVVYKSVV